MTEKRYSPSYKSILKEKVNREDLLESIVITRVGDIFVGEIMHGSERPDVIVLGPEAQKLHGRPTGEDQPAFVRI